MSIISLKSCVSVVDSFFVRDSGWIISGYTLGCKN